MPMARVKDANIMSHANLLIYTASISFWCGNITQSFPICGTSCTCSSFDVFLDYCRMEVKYKPIFTFSNVEIVAMESRVLPDNTLFMQRKQEIKLQNYDAVKAREYFTKTLQID